MAQEEHAMTREAYDREVGWQIGVVHLAEDTRDLAHEADMRRLRREQLRAEVCDEEEWKSYGA